MPKTKEPQNEGGMHTIGNERTQVSILPRPDDIRRGRLFPERNIEDLRVKGKGRTLGEYFREAERDTLVRERQETPEQSQVLVARPSPSPERGGGTTMHTGSSLDLHMMSSTQSGSGESITTNIGSEGEEDPCCPKMHVRFASENIGSETESTDSIEDRWRYARDNERELLYKRRMQQAEYAQACMERKVAQMTDWIRASEKMVIKATQKLREAEREKEVTEKRLTYADQDVR